MKSYSAILNEVSQAADYVRAGGVIPNIVTNDADFYTSLADLPDDAILTDYATELPEFGPSAVTVGTVQEFELVYHALGVVHGFPVDRYKIDYEIEHENAHLAATQQVGYKEMRYGLLVNFSNPLRSYGWRPFHTYAQPVEAVTKLALGSQVAAPPRLSDGDYLRLNAMGYTGQHDIGRRIVTSSNPRSSSLRLPSGFIMRG